MKTGRMMLKRHGWWLVLLFIVAGFGLAQAGTVTISPFKVWLPDGEWKTQSLNEYVSCREQSGDAGVELVAPPDSDTLGKVRAGLAALVSRFVTDLKLGGTKKLQVNGLHAEYIEGTGKVKGVPVSIFLGLYEGKGRTLVALAYARTDRLDRHLPTLKRILKSVTAE